ncbi:MAG: hypothetical protein NT137_06785 [Methanomassiliicoccales archaeon]|nr:hypothetical protein [Methanomassiliicoccales archaeon]
MWTWIEWLMMIGSGLFLAGAFVAVGGSSALLPGVALIAGGVLLILLGAWSFRKARESGGENGIVSDGHQR